MNVGALTFSRSLNLLTSRSLLISHQMLTPSSPPAATSLPGAKNDCENRLHQPLNCRDRIAPSTLHSLIEPSLSPVSTDWLSGEKSRSDRAFVTPLRETADQTGRLVAPEHES